jgi:hypothetical protein
MRIRRMKQSFKPTWLYLKQHNVTGLKYFGKTIRDPKKYFGSGIVWTNHLKKYGYDVDTVWVKLFNDKEELTQFALEYSKVHNIVESKEYANLVPEDGLMGGDTGITDNGRKIISEKSKKHRHTEATKQKLREARLKQTDPRLGKKHSPETIEKIRQKRALQIMPVGRKLSEESKRKIAESQKNRYAMGRVS